MDGTSNRELLVMKSFRLLRNKGLPAQVGFTLIELLIVIALLGALAIGLLATIDPFEQLKKGRDTSTRNTTAEFYNANLRYYAVKSQFPWGTGATSGSLAAVTGNVIQALITQGELKQRFIELAGTNNLARIFFNSTAADHVAVCFDPESKSFNGDANTIYNVSGSPAGQANCLGFTPPGTSDACYFCIQ